MDSLTRLLCLLACLPVQVSASQLGKQPAIHIIADQLDKCFVNFEHSCGDFPLKLLWCPPPALHTTAFALLAQLDRHTDSRECYLNSMYVLQLAAFVVEKQSG